MCWVEGVLVLQRWGVCARWSLRFGICELTLALLPLEQRRSLGMTPRASHGCLGMLWLPLQ